MQTFLPYPDFVASAKVLDRQRLGKQRVEVLQILKAMDSGGGWANHPATRMWRGHTSYLARYGLVICDEWLWRGYRDTCWEKIKVFFDRVASIKPSWLGDPMFHASHRSNLLRKDPIWYGQFGWTESADLKYVWPVV